MRGSCPAPLMLCLPAEHVPAGPAAPGVHPESDPGWGESRCAQEGAWSLLPSCGTARHGVGSGHCSPRSALPQDHHLPLSFHRRQEELKFNLGLQRLQHRVHRIQALRDAPTGEGMHQDGAHGAARPAVLRHHLPTLMGVPHPSPQPLCRTHS